MQQLLNYRHCLFLARIYYTILQHCLRVSTFMKKRCILIKIILESSVFGEFHMQLGHSVDRIALLATIKLKFPF